MQWLSAANRLWAVDNLKGHSRSQSRHGLLCTIHHEGNSMVVTARIPTMLAGSAMTAFGFGVGKDAYRAAKKSIVHILGFFLIGGVVLISRQSMVWFFRNYRSVIDGIVVRAFSLVAFLFGSVITWGFFALIIDAFLLDLMPEKARQPILASYWFFEAIIIGVLAQADQIFDVSMSAGIVTDSGLDIMERTRLIIASSGLCLAGLIVNGVSVGIKDRGKRRIAWRAEEHNKKFLEEQGLVEVSEGQFKDREGNAFRLENVYPGIIGLFAVRRRNKRGYISFDADGVFYKWTGLVSKTA